MYLLTKLVCEQYSLFDTGQLCSRGLPKLYFKHDDESLCSWEFINGKIEVHDFSYSNLR